MKHKRHEIRLSNLTDATLGRMVRAGLLAIHLDGQQGRIEQARQVAQKRQERDVALLARQRQEMDEQPGLFALGAVQIKDVLVPALDVREKVLGEVVPGVVRSPYNRARHRLGEGLLDPETTTWEVLRVEHLRLTEVAATLPTKASMQASTVQISALLDESALVARQRKVQALIDNLGCSPTYAEALMTRLEAQ